MIEEIALASLLHDIGKLIKRAFGERKNHQDLGADWLEKKGLKGIIPGAARYHHSDRFGEIANSNYLLLIYEADNLSAGERRIKGDLLSESITGEFEERVPLLSIFSRVSLDPDKPDTVKPIFVSPFYLDEGSYIPPEINKEQMGFEELRAKTIPQSTYRELWTHFEKEFDLINNTKALSTNTLLFLLQKYTSTIPSHTLVALDKEKGGILWGQFPDVSLFDHLKSTAAISGALYRYILEKCRERFYNEQLINEITSEESRLEKRFLLIGADLSGIQDFIYTVTTTGALKTLRGRSFYIEMLCHHLAREITNALELTTANIVFVGGGGFVLLAQNTDTAKRVIMQTMEKTNSYLFDRFGTNLYLGFSLTELSGYEIAGTGLEKGQRDFGTIWKSLREAIDTQKLRKWKNNLHWILKPHEPKKENCQICREEVEEITPIDEDKNLSGCTYCRHFYEIGKKLGSKRYRFIIKNPPMESDFEINGSSYAISEHPSDSETVFVINSLDPEDYKNRNSIFIPYGRYGVTGEFDELSELSTGVKRIGALRMDVDNLGQIFSRGLKRIRNSQEISYQSFSRIASLSRELNLFFNFYLTQILECKLFKDFRSLRLLNEPQPRKAVIIYAGGDDLFITGSWDDVVETAFDIHRCFKLHTGENPYLDLSAGVGIFRTKYPLYKMAQETGELEENAKRNIKDKEEKRSVCLFRSDLVFKWSEADKILDTMRLLLNLTTQTNGRLRFKLPRKFIYEVLKVYEELDSLEAFWHPKLFYITTRTGEKLKSEENKKDWYVLRNEIMKPDNKKYITASLIWLDLFLRGGERND
ncbi:CRISPR-associated protein Cas10/Csm1 [bacterium HR37]|nr:CRISPR-associated protein Cas10/Csm1 [bacterium HR37]